MGECPICKSTNNHVYADCFICFDCKNRINFFQFKHEVSDIKVTPATMSFTSTGKNNYHHVWLDVLTNLVVSKDGMNTTYRGHPQFIFRDGDSAFGKEFIMQFVIDQELNRYPSSSPFNHVEFYLPKEIAIAKLKELLKILEEIPSEVQSQQNVIEGGQG